MEPEYTSLGRRVVDRIGPMQPEEVDSQYGYAFGNLVEAMMRMYRDLALLIDPEEDPLVPWQPLFDVDICPEWALPWLAQVVGVKLPTYLTGEQSRQYIKELSFEQIGKPETIRNVVQMYLTGDQTVYFRERDNGDPYALEIITIESETPDQVAIDRAIKDSVPAGIIVNYRVVTSWDYQQMTTEGGSYSALPAKFSIYLQLRENDRV